MLYLLESSEYYKVGYTEGTSTLEKRMQSYNTHNPDFKLIDTFYGDRVTEKRIHKELEEYKHKGEWFIKNKETKNFMENIQIFLVISTLQDITGSSKYLYIDKLPNEEAYSYHRIILNSILVNFIIYDSNKLVVYLDKPGGAKNFLLFDNLNIKDIYLDYSVETGYRCFRGVLFETGYIIIEVRDSKLHNQYETLIYPDQTQLFNNSFTREDFKIIDY